jgi:hypothetical protein
MLRKTGILIFFVLVLNAAAKSEPVFIAELPTPGEFTLFANGGWSGNWYVGHNHGWVSNLGPVDPKGFKTVFIGARLGRAKTQEQIEEFFKTQSEEEKDISAGPYSILIGVSDSKDKRPKGKVLVTTDMIPLEGSPVMALEGVTESRWFWVQISKKHLSPNQDNFIHLWSEDKDLNNEAVSPVLAGGIGSNTRGNSFLVLEDDMKIIKFFEPAIAIKLIPDNPPVPEIDITGFEQHQIDPSKYIVKTKVTGDYITEVIIELDKGRGWEQVKTVTNPPYDLVFNYKDLEGREYRLRCRAKNWWEQTGYSPEKKFRIEGEGE